MQQEHIERFIMLASLEMPNLIVSTLFQGAELSDESTLLTFSLPQKYLLEELIDELEDRDGINPFIPPHPLGRYHLWSSLLCVF